MAYFFGPPCTVNRQYSLLFIEIVAIRWHTLQLKCTKFDFGRDSAPDPVGDAYALPDPLAEFQGPTSKGNGGKGRGYRRGCRRAKLERKG